MFLATGLKSSTTNFIGEAHAAYNPSAPLIGICPLKEVLGHPFLDMREGCPSEDAETAPPARRVFNFPRALSDGSIERAQSVGSDADIQRTQSTGRSSQAHGNQNVNAMTYKEMTVQHDNCDTWSESLTKELVPKFTYLPIHTFSR